jgi:hypothetical protein
MVELEGCENVMGEMHDEMVRALRLCIVDPCSITNICSVRCALFLRHDLQDLRKLEKSTQLMDHAL